MKNVNKQSLVSPDMVSFRVQKCSEAHLQLGLSWPSWGS